MNNANIQATIDTIKASKHFDMSTYTDNVFVPNDQPNPEFSTPSTLTSSLDNGHYCKTAACIAGHAAFIADPKRFEIVHADDLSDIARDWLGLDYDQARDLFLVEGNTVPDGVTLNSASKDEAIVTLQGLLDTGIVDWSHAEPSPEYEDPEDYWDTDDDA